MFDNNEYDVREYDDELTDVGGAYVVPSAKVRLPEHVTKLRKRAPDRHDDNDEWEA